MGVKVLNPGLASTIQDAGRYGYYHVGIPPSGALDQYAYLAANLLLGNDENAAVIESTYMGPELEFEQDTVVAITGAELPPKFNGNEAPLWESFAVKGGDKLSFDYLRSGANCYIAVAGGFDVPVILGSRSTYGLGAFGGHEGRKLQADDVLPVGNSNAQPGKKVPAELIPKYETEVDVRVVMGLYDHLLTEKGRQTFLDTVWTLTPVADRIGYRYKGNDLEFIKREQPFGAGSDPSNIVDAGYPVGSIQVPGGVEPIMLNRDAVSGGGYAMICTVISPDMDVVGQTQPNSKTRFVPVSMDEALAARREYKARRDSLRAALG